MKQIVKKCFNVQWGRLFSLVLLIAVSVSQWTSAQDIYEYKGFIALHPYFEHKTFLTEQNRVDILASRRFLDSSPSAVSYTAAGDKSAGAYISGDSLYVVTSTLSVNSCTCCKNSLQFTAPRLIGPLPFQINSTTPLYMVRTGKLDTIELLIGSTDGALHRITIDMSTFIISGQTTLVLSSATGKTITSLNGTSSGYDTPDTGVWVTGTQGMIRYLSYTGAILKDESIHDIAGTETVLCYGDDYAATSGGKIYRRSISGQFGLVTDVKAAIYTIDSKGASGSGVVFVNSYGTFKKIYTGTSVFRSHYMTANADGIVCEVIDSKWECDTIIDGNSETVIQSIQPISLFALVNKQSIYAYKQMEPETLSIHLGDTEGNFQLPRVITKTRLGDTVELHSDGVYTIQNADPSQFCKQGNLSMADSIANVVVSPYSVVVETSGKLGTMDLVCEECVLKEYPFRIGATWMPGDSLFIQTASQKIKIVNMASQVQSTTRFINHTAKQFTLYINAAGTYSLRLAVPFNPADILDIQAFSLQGQKIPILYNKSGVVSVNSLHQIVTLRIHLPNGTVYTMRSVMIPR